MKWQGNTLTASAENRDAVPIGKETRSLLGVGLLVAALLVYGAGAMLIMATHTSSTVSGWLAGTVTALVALGLLTSNLRVPFRITPITHSSNSSDPWAEQWEELMQRPIQ